VSDAPTAIGLESASVCDTELAAHNWQRATIQQIEEAGETPTQKARVTVMNRQPSGLPRFPAAATQLAQVRV
jgi:hypothetical protein